jgi:hypothetical protein
MAQETLEDACDRVLNYLYPNCKKEMSSLQYGNSINSLKSIAKWQQERSNEMFTKDDLIAFYEFIKKECDIVNTSGYAETHTNWFIEKLKNYEIKR